MENNYFVFCLPCACLARLCPSCHVILHGVLLLNRDLGEGCFKLH